MLRAITWEVPSSKCADRRRTCFRLDSDDALAETARCDADANGGSCGCTDSSGKDAATVVVAEVAVGAAGAVPLVSASCVTAFVISR